MSVWIMKSAESIGLDEGRQGKRRGRARGGGEGRITAFEHLM